MIPWTIRICGILFAAICFYSAWQGAVKNSAFTSHGQRATAEPITQYQETTTTKTQLGIKVSEEKVEHADIFFTTQDGQRIRVKLRLPSEVLGKFEAREPVSVEYLPEDPRTARFVGESAYPVTSALFGLVAAFATYFFWRRV